MHPMRLGMMRSLAEYFPEEKLLPLPQHEAVGVVEEAHGNGAAVELSLNGESPLFARLPFNLPGGCL